MNKITIERRDNAHGTNLVDKEQPIILVRCGSWSTLMGQWTTLCLQEGPITAVNATDEQIKRAVLTDESVF